MFILTSKPAWLARRSSLRCAVAAFPIISDLRSLSLRIDASVVLHSLCNSKSSDVRLKSATGSSLARICLRSTFPTCLSSPPSAGTIAVLVGGDAFLQSRWTFLSPTETKV